MVKFTQEELDEVNKTLSTPEDCLKWAFDNLHPKLAKASSFGAEDAAIVDMMFKINSDSRLFTLDTGRLPQATYDVMDEIRKRYNTKIEILFPDAKEDEEYAGSCKWRAESWGYSKGRCFGDNWRDWDCRWHWIYH